MLGQYWGGVMIVIYVLNMTLIVLTGPLNTNPNNDIHMLRIYTV